MQVIREVYSAQPYFFPTRNNNKMEKFLFLLLNFRFCSRRNHRCDKVTRVCYNETRFEKKGQKYIQVGSKPKD